MKSSFIITLFLVNFCYSPDESYVEEKNRSRSSYHLIHSSNKSYFPRGYDKIVVTCLMLKNNPDGGVQVILTPYKSLAFNIFDKTIGHVISSGTSHKVITHIDELFLIKKYPIVIKKSLRPPVIADYPYIKITGYLKGKTVMERSIKMYNTIEFSSQFLKFYELVSSCNHPKN